MNRTERDAIRRPATVSTEGAFVLLAIVAALVGVAAATAGAVA